MSNEVRLQFKYTEKEFTKAYNQLPKNRVSSLFDFIVAFGLIVYGVYLMRVGELSYWPYVMMGIALFLILLIVIRSTLVPAMIFRREPKYKEEYVLCFTEDGIHFRAGSLVDSRIQWDYYKNVQETRDFIFLIYMKNGKTILPKRVFRDEEEYREFMNLVRKRI